MGYFLPETESGAVQRRWAEPEGAGAERQLLITAVQECTSFPTEKPCWVRVMPGSLAVSSLMNTCNDSWGESQWACQASGVSGGKPGESQSKAMEQDVRAAPIASYSSSATCGLTDEPHRNAGTTEITVALSSGTCDYFWPLRLEHPNATCLASVFT